LKFRRVRGIKKAVWVSEDQNGKTTVLFTDVDPDQAPELLEPTVGTPADKITVLIQEVGYDEE